MMTAADVLMSVRDQLQDNGVRWKTPELLQYLGDGAMQVAVLAAPAELSVFRQLSLQTGALQQLPDDLLRLQGIPGISKVSMRDMNDTVPGWMQAKAGKPVHVVVTENAPDNIFHVYPPASAGQILHVQALARPIAPVNEASTIPLKAEWRAALIDYVLYRAFAKDADYAGNAARAATHQAAFAASVGGKS